MHVYAASSLTDRSEPGITERWSKTGGRTGDYLGRPGGCLAFSLSHRLRDGETLRDVSGVCMEGIVMACIHSAVLSFYSGALLQGFAVR